MAGTFPTLNGFKAIRFRSVDPTLQSFAASGKYHGRKRGGSVQHYEFTLRYPSLTRAQVDTVMAFVALQRGGFDRFDLVLPVYSTPRGVATGTPLVANAGGYAAGATSIVVDGWTASQTGILLQNDKLTFAGHSKVYPIISDTDSDGSGLATLTIPPLLEAVTDNEVLTVTAVPFNVIVEGEAHEFKADASRGPDRHAVEVDVREVW